MILFHNNTGQFRGHITKMGEIRQWHRIAQLPFTSCRCIFPRSQNIAINDVA